MPFSTSPSRRQRARAARASILVAILLAGPALAAEPAGAESWRWHPWVTLSSGYENDRVIDPDVDRVVVPGGPFLGLAPGLTAYRRLGRTEVGLTGQGSFEQFTGDDDRALYSVSANADGRGVLRGPWRWRVAAAGSYYAEPDRDSVNRWGGGADAAIRFAATRWYLEARGGADGRRYDHLTTLDDAGVAGVYTERSFSTGATAGLLLTDALALTADVSRRTTDARDPAFDAVSYRSRLSLETRVGRAGWLSVHGLGEWRTFDARDPGADTDDYWQVGAGYAHRVSDTIVITPRYAFARYAQPSLPDQDTHRVSLGITLRFGGPALAVPVPARRDDGVERFRVHAPDAAQVSLVGDFNGWDPSSHPMTRRDDGWWETALRLPAGTWQYAYRVDGRTVPPEDAETTVDDGFGGINGVITIAEADR